MAAPDGFFSRWSRRKTAAAQGLPVEEPVPALTVSVGPGTHGPAAAPSIVPSAEAVSSVPQAAPAASDPVEAAPLTLDDAAALTQESDFKPFVMRGVAPEVRNAAMKKLFADPRFNVMDRMDIYIDDYSQPDPLPKSMLRQMTSAKFLNLFDEQPEPCANPDTQAPGDVRQSGTANPLPDTTHDAHADLRLQPHHAPVGPEPGQGAERDADAT